MIDYTMSDEVRKRLKLPLMAESLEAIASAAHGSAKAEQTGILVPSHHFHLHAEVGWAGAASPILPTLADVNKALRLIAEEPWCAGLQADTHAFPGTLFFAMRHRAVPIESASWVRWQSTVRLVVRECDGDRIEGGSHSPCNRLGVWR
jgi:hypothetical protein